MANPNTVCANAFVDALVAAGLRRVCFAPGSRHTPLILAFARHQSAIDITSHLDERSAAFFALGCALGADETVALVCTSGSAAANFFPAIIEAHESGLPLLVLSADRPHESRHSGANQTIDQVKLFGDYAAWFYDAPLPEKEAPPVVLRNLRTLAARALDKTSEGVVHINFPFRKPFEPREEDARAMTIDRRPPTRILRSMPSHPTALDRLMGEELLQGRGLVHFGHGSCRTEEEARALQRWAAAFARASGYPMLAEFTSNMRRTQSIDGRTVASLGAYESFINAEFLDLSSIDTLIRFGGPPLSNAMRDFFAGLDLERIIVCGRDGRWTDDSHRATELVEFHPLAADGLTVAEGRPSAEMAALRERLHRAEAIAWQTIAREIATGDYFDGGAVYDVADLIPEQGLIFAGNSLPVRHLDQFGRPSDKAILALSNRGASGIDGNISSALGVGAAYPERPLAVIVGDITFYHDMNGLLAVRRCGVPVTVVVLNNGGGGIFHRLPIHSFEPLFSEYFLTAHGLDFSHAAAMYGLEYRRAEDRESFRGAFRESIEGRRSTVIELRTDAREDLRRREEIMAAVHGALAKE